MSEKNISIETRTKILKLRGNGGDSSTNEKKTIVFCLRKKNISIETRTKILNLRGNGGDSSTYEKKTIVFSLRKKNISIEARTKVLKLRGNGGGVEDRLLTRPYHRRQLQLDQNARKVFNICKQLKKETFAFAKKQK